MRNYLRPGIGDSGMVDDATLRRFCRVVRCQVRRGTCASTNQLPDASLLPLPIGKREGQRFKASLGLRRGAIAWSRRGWRAGFESAIENGVEFRPTTTIEDVLLGDEAALSGGSILAWTQTSLSLILQAQVSYKVPTFRTVHLGLVDWYDNRADTTHRAHAEPGLPGTGAVILAVGGFASNREMTAKHMPFLFDRAFPLRTRGDDSPGICLGIAIGGVVSHMDRYSAWCFMHPPRVRLEGVAVGWDGSWIASDDM